MYAVVRVYQVDPARLREIDEIVRERFLPVIGRVPGLVSFYGIEAGHGKWMSVTVFESKDAADAANGLAAQLVGQWLLPMVRQGPEISSGEVVAHACPGAPR